MGNNTKQRRAQASSAAEKPITEHTLSAFEKSQAANNPMVKRIIRALRCAWEQIAEREDALWREQDERRLDNEKRDKQSVLVVVHIDGWVEVYADRGVSVGGLELTFLDADDEMTWKEKVPYSMKHLLELKPTKELFPRYLNRPNQYTDEAFVRALEHAGRIERDIRISEWAQQALERMKQ